ncbi:MAG: type II toxin-antitoxin system RelE/ParE family toxin [Acidobacteriota bacterium]|nr:type II toxin-antitoxin system RelE/ParE family toxin [Blastocatellia bacterium]MDW8241071.1 type II toxin-antitoxin system RelE/ParE family toxin [Acidobacteriota bacterium]
MKAQFKASFARDLQSIREKATLKRIQEAIEQVEQARSLQEITNLKKLKGGGNYYRIRIGEYRIGIIVEGDAITFVRCLHRKEIYRYFP